MPLADKLPKPADLVANAYDFAGQLLASQRKFAEDVLDATAPRARQQRSGHGQEDRRRGQVTARRHRSVRGGRGPRAVSPRTRMLSKLSVSPAGR